MDLERQAVSRFFERYKEEKAFCVDSIDVLAAAALDEDERKSRRGLDGIFRDIIERLCDSFDENQAALYDQVMVRIVSQCRNRVECRLFDEELDSFGLHDAGDFFTRKALLDRDLKNGEVQLSRIARIFVLPRVSLGADVAITSVILAGLKDLATSAEIAFISAKKQKELFGGDARIRIIELEYERRGGLLGRFSVWQSLLEIIRNETEGLEHDEYLVIDPDSRIAQLGVLPVTQRVENHLFFNSRRFRHPECESLGALTGAWFQRIFGGKKEIFPYVSLLREDRERASLLRSRLRTSGRRRIIAVSFGVGGNEKKRFDDVFEERCLLDLLKAGNAVIFDKGAGEEVEKANRTIGGLRSAGYSVLELTGDCSHQAGKADGATDVVAWDGSIGRFAALTGECDEYIGYDSSGQHIAAAQGIPVLSVFVDDNPPIFVKRWRPCGPGSIEIIEQRERTGKGREQLLKQIETYRKMRDGEVLRLRRE